MLTRVNALILLLAIVLIVHLYPYRGLTGAQSETVLALGFVMLAGYLIGEILSFATLPKITGYLLAGMIFGPYITGLISIEVVKDLTLIDQFALALIALTAGGEVHLDALKRNAWGIASLCFFQLFGIFLLIAFLFYNVSGYFTFLQHASILSILGAAMVFAAIAVSQSPSITIAVITETKSAGISTDIVLGVCVLMDILVIVLYTAVLSLVANIEAGTGSVGLRQFVILGSEIILSVALGVVAGWLVTYYLNRIHQNPVLFLLAFCYLVTEGSRSIHLDPVLVCLTAGIWVTNASKRGEALIDTIESGSLIIYVIFFCVSGARLDLVSLSQMWFGAMILVSARTFFIWLTTWLGIKTANIPLPAPGSYWMAFLPQAGVSLGLVAILAKNPVSWGPELSTLMIACIAINQIIGPITTKYALQQAGEIGRAR